MREAHHRLGWVILLGVLIALLAFALRVYRLDAQSLWYDEGNSVRLAERALPEVVQGAAADIHPPGYYLLLAGWERLAGHSAFAMRYISVLSSVLTVAVLIALGRRLFSPGVGVLAGLLGAIHPLVVYYAQEARMYALLGLLSAASLLLAAEVLSIPGEMAAGRLRRRRAALVIGAYVLVHAAGLYTHYSYPFVIAAETLTFLLWLARRPRKLHGLAVWAGLQLAVLLLFLPQLPTALRQVLNWPRGIMEPAGALSMLSALAYGISVIPAQMAGALIPLGLLSVLGLFPPVEETPRYLRFEERLMLVAGWLLIVPVALAAANAMIDANLKFLVSPALALCLLAARGAVMGARIARPVPGIGRTGSRLTLFIVGLIALVGLVPMLIGLRNLYFDPAYARDDYRGLAAQIMAEAGPEAAVVLVAPNQWEVFTYYYPDGPGVTPLGRIRPAAPDPKLLHLLDGYERIYGVYWGDWQPDPHRTVESYLEEHTFPVRTQWFGDVRLVTYAVPAPPATEIATPSHARFGDQIELVGYTLSGATVNPGNALGITLFWRIDAPTQERYKVFVHLYWPDGSIIAQHDAEPGNNLKPTWVWEPGTLVVDAHGVLIPADLPPGEYPLMVGMYGAFDDVRLPVMLDGTVQGDRLRLGNITVQANK